MMNKLRSYRLTVASLVILPVALPIIDGRYSVAEAADPPVTVTNSPSSPVPVQDVDNAARQPFQTATTITNAFNPSGFTITVVPSGKRLIIEFVSASCTPTGAGTVVPNPLNITTQHPFFIPLTPGKTVGTAVASQLTRIYAEPGTKVNLTVYPASNAATVSCTA